jgi:hypothetical protein
MVHIGAVVERTGLSHRTIRYYEEMGLVAPAGARRAASGSTTTPGSRGCSSSRR